MRKYSVRTEESYVGWVRQYILFHNKVHPRQLDGSAIATFIEHYSVNRQASSSTIRQAMSALVFFYAHVLAIDLPWIDNLATPKKPVFVPTVLTAKEIVVRQAKGKKDWRTCLPAAMVQSLSAHIHQVRAVWAEYRRLNFPGVSLPDGLENKYPHYGKEWPWFWLFPARFLSTDPRSKVR